MNKVPFLSIVIPVYNAAFCICRCLDSIWSQGMDEGDYEVICVDDCSSDNTLDALREVQKCHLNMRVLHNEQNLRAGGSRNHGVREARGQYVCFIDADDYYHAGALRAACDAVRTHDLDILVCDFARHAEGKENDTLVHRFPHAKVMTGRNFMVENSLPHAPWKYLFRRSLMVEQGIWFEGRVSCEDADWTHKIALHAERVKYEPILLVHYILMPTSQTAAEYRRKETVYHRLFSGYRIAKLSEYCHTEAERSHINAVAEAISWNGLLFLNALFTSPFEKNRVMKKYLDGVRGKRVDMVRRYSFCMRWHLLCLRLLFA